MVEKFMIVLRGQKLFRQDQQINEAFLEFICGWMYIGIKIKSDARRDVVRALRDLSKQHTQHIVGCHHGKFTSRRLGVKSFSRRQSTSCTHEDVVHRCSEASTERRRHEIMPDMHQQLVVEVFPKTRQCVAYGRLTEINDSTGARRAALG